MRRLSKIVLLVFLLFVSYSVAESGEPLTDRYEVIFRGQPLPELLQAAVSILCTSDVAATTGYYQGFEGTDLVSNLAKQSRTQKWDIWFQGDNAIDRVTSQRYQVVRRDGSGVIMVGLNEGPIGSTVEVISIDSSNGSFVSSRTGASSLANRTNVFVGRCEKLLGGSP